LQSWISFSNVVCVQPDFVFSAEAVSSSHQFLLTPREKGFCAEASPLESKVHFFYSHFLLVGFCSCLEISINRVFHAGLILFVSALSLDSHGPGLSAALPAARTPPSVLVFFYRPAPSIVSAVLILPVSCFLTGFWFWLIRFSLPVSVCASRAHLSSVRRQSPPF
jgi:hypothetical protein